MVQINFARKEINCKVVYYGPGLSGKTTSLEVVHQKTPESNKGDLTSISTDGDRTLFFDFMPLDLGNIAGMKTKFHLYTVPGQVYYNSTRKLVLLGADGIIFVADSSPGRMDDNLQSMENLRQNLAEMGRDINKIPLVIQYNKRDIPNAVSVEELEKGLNPNGVPSYEASAKTGEGIFQTLKAISALVLDDINSNEKKVLAAGQEAGVARRPSLKPVAPMSASGNSADLGLLPHQDVGKVLRPAAPMARTDAPGPATTARPTAGGGRAPQRPARGNPAPRPRQSAPRPGAPARPTPKPRAGQPAAQRPPQPPARPAPAPRAAPARQASGTPAHPSEARRGPAPTQRPVASSPARVAAPPAPQRTRPAAPVAEPLDAMEVPLEAPRTRSRSTVNQSRQALAEQIRTAGEATTRPRRSRPGRPAQQSTGPSNSKLVAFLVVGILAGAVAAVLAVKFFMDLG